MRRGDETFRLTCHRMKLRSGACAQRKLSECFRADHPARRSSAPIEPANYQLSTSNYQLLRSIHPTPPTSPPVHSPPTPGQHPLKPLQFPLDLGSFAQTLSPCIQHRPARRNRASIASAALHCLQSHTSSTRSPLEALTFLIRLTICFIACSNNTLLGK